MRKFYLGLWIWLLTCFCAMQGKSQSFSADFETAPASACETSAGCTSFVLKLAGVDFVFAFDGAGDGGDMQHLPANGGEGGSGSMDIQSDTFIPGTIEKVTIARQDGKLFRFNQLY